MRVVRRLSWLTKVSMMSLLLAACGGQGEETSGDGGADGAGSGALEAVFHFSSGVTSTLEATTATSQEGSCSGFSDGYGVIISWDPSAPPAVGAHPLVDSSSVPTVDVGYPAGGGETAISWLSNGTLELTVADGDLEGTFSGSVDFKELDSVDGWFRCVDAL